jgi:two-component system chemotaxis response regulator CheB
MPIKVLVVDDSALVRKLLSAMLMRAPDIQVVGTASDPYAAREKIKSLNPDVITLDVEMPRMDGITFLENLMRLRPMPVVMVSSLTQRGADVTLRALELGAIDFVAKPRIDIAGTLEDYENELIAKVRVAAQARVLPRSAKRARELDERNSTSAVVPALSARAMLRTTDRIIAIGASTGGTEAIREVLEEMPPDAPAIAARRWPSAKRRTDSRFFRATCISLLATATCWSSATARATSVV